MLNNKQISFAGPDNTKDGDRSWAGLSRNIRLPLLVAFNHFTIAIEKAEFVVVVVVLAVVVLAVVVAFLLLLCCFVAFPTTTTINYLDIFTPK